MEKVKKEKGIEEIVKAVSGATQEKTNYMIAWLDGWECRKNAEISERSQSKASKQELSV